MKKLLITLILLAAAGGGGYAYYNKYVKVEDKASVTQSPVSTGSIVQEVQATGTLEAMRTVQVGSQVSGVVKKLYVDFNSMVHKDQLLAELDPSLLQVQVDIQEANIARQVGDIDQQKVQLENDKLNLSRTKTQADKGLVSVQALEAAALQVKSREAQIVSADRQLVQARASLSQAKLNVAYTKIVSPIDGVVVNRNVDEGQTVQSSVNVATFFTIATDLTTLKLSAGIDEAEIGFIRPNMQVTFTVDSYGTRQFRGNVDAVRLNASTANNVVTYPVWITVQNSDYKLRPSMTANLRIVVDRADNVLRVPNQALRFRPTTDIYTWLGMPAPALGVGRGRGANANAAPGAPGAPGAPAGDAAAAGAPGARPGQPPPANAEALGAGGGRRQRDPNAAPGQGGFGQGQTGQDPQANAAGGGRRQRDPNAQMAQGGGFGGGQNPGGGRGGDPTQGGRGGNRGGGFGQGMQNMTPEQIAQFRANGGGRGGGRGGDPTQGGQGGRGGGRGQRVGNEPAAAAGPPLAERNATKIDELFEPIVKPDSNGQVWIYNEKAADPKDRLKQINVRLGLTNTQFSQLISGEGLSVGSMVVTGVVPPPSAVKAAQSNNSILNQNQRGGQQPFGGGGPGGPGGGAPGGGRGGGGGGGGGGRGGN